MLFQEEEAMLFCTHCGKETLHTVTYVNDKISSIECAECHQMTSIDIDAMEEFHQHLFARIMSKPGRMTEEARQDLSKFLATLPLRIVSKPIRFSSEYNQMNKAVKEFMVEQHERRLKEEEALNEGEESED